MKSELSTPTGGRKGSSIFFITGSGSLKMRTNEEKMSIRWLRAGTLLDDRYRITGVLGEGGFGITYAACHNDIDRPAAIKEFFCRDFMNRDARVMKMYSSRMRKTGSCMIIISKNFCRKPGSCRKYPVWTELCG